MATSRPTRRELMQGLALSGGLAAMGGFLPLLSRAQAAEVRDDLYFVFCYFNGGWDLLLSLDPRDPRIFRDDLKKTNGIQTGYAEQSAGYDDLVDTGIDGMVFGPHIGNLASHADKLTVVRGMTMDTLTHEVGRRRFLTGRPPAGLQAQGSSLATVLAAEIGAGEPIPQLSVRVESYNADMPSFASAIRVNSVSDLVRALQPSPAAITTAEAAAVEALLAHERACGRFDGSQYMTEAFGFRDAAQDLVSLGLHSEFAFDASTPRMEALRALYGIDPKDMSGSPAQAAAAVTAITSGISRCVSIEATRGLDTHGPEWASSHGRSLRDGFDVCAALIGDLVSRQYKDTADSWLDHTVVVGFSEFGRSPLLNSSGGRDHYLHNACFLAGGGIQGGRVLGRTSDSGMTPTRASLATGSPDAAGEILKPEHVFRALMRHAGIEEDPGRLDVDAFEALLA